MPIKYDVESLKKLSTNELRGLWNRFFKFEAPDWLHRSYLVKYTAWHKKYGTLDSQTQKKINKLVEKYEKTKEVILDPKQKTSVTIVNPGTKLIREFRGKKHEVTVIDKGFVYNKQTYKSLSAIANEITGTRWNGKKFFGVAK